MELTKDTEAQDLASKTEGAAEKFIVTKEHSFDEIIAAHKAKKAIHFAGDPENFKKLDPEEFAALPKALMTYYYIAEQESVGKLQDLVNTAAKSDSIGREFGYERRDADAFDQLEVLGIDEKKWKPKWVRAYDNEVRKFKRKGYVIAKKDDAKTFANDKGEKNFHYVGSEDSPEMVLMKIPIERWEENQRRIKEPARQFKEAAKQKYVDSINQLGLTGAKPTAESVN